MEKIIRKKFIRLFIEGLFIVMAMMWFVFICYALEQPILYISVIVFFVIFFFANTKSSLREINQIRIMYPIGKAFREYVEAQDFEYIDFDYPDRISYPVNKDVDQYLIVTDPDRRLIPFRETASPFPERYSFYISKENPQYLYIYDNYNFKRYLTRK